MHKAPLCSGALLTFLFLFFTSLAAAQTVSSGAPEISFTVAMPRPHTHLFEIDIAIKRGPSSTVPAHEQLVMPVWTPGSYLIREFQRHVQDFSAADAAGQPLKWEKTNKTTWRVTTNGAREWHAKYRVYANELTVRTSELNSSHAFWNNANLLMYLDGYLKSPATVRVVAPDVWKVATGLPGVPGQRNTFRAENFDVLYDSPFEASDFKSIVFNVKGVPHRIVIDGEGNYDPERMRRDVQKIVETQVELMGGEIPYRDYTFFLHLRNDAGGGLEHANSTALGYPRFGFRITRGDRATSAAPVTSGPPERDYRGFLSLVSHEFFHLWNVKRIRPDVLGPFDYTQENYTKLLWVAEGITDYYADIALRRAGLITENEFLSATARAIQTLQNTPGRMEQSVEESSFDTWIKFYRPDENSVNSQVSYYDKGAILGLLLDLEIRKRTSGAKSLDDVMRYLYTEFFKQQRNYTPADFQKAAELAAGSSLEEFFAKYVRNTDELDYNSALAAAGLQLDTGITRTDGDKPVERVFFGADVVEQDERLMVRRVYAGSPAYEQGLNAGDQIVALDNMRVTRDFFNARLAEKKPGDLINLTIFRFDNLSTLLIKLGGRADGTYRITTLPSQTEVQKQIYRAWLGSRT
ncbi:MAG TPA: PDZ domain-containing protein [Pyrinomonadaceae bacterium]|nr:PDZ domain-containing protein [Pyrinomonadaceae bacterium]